MKDRSMFWVAFTTLILVLVTLVASMDFAFKWVFFLTILGQTFLIVMVLRVLKSDYTTQKTFDDFYEDYPIGRNS
ncbi:MAG: hypothetical protein OER83_04330 [Flavobacteriaceae bacterium]|nr:hypothetical protein [Flavobacteriaceae bacterium]MDH3796081.1 hypothetical protein [Flavobacteriaceae bacterium]